MFVNEVFTGNEFNPATFPKLDETFRIVDEIIKNLDDGSLMQMLQGNEGDIDDLLTLMTNETYDVLYGNGGIGTREIDFNYIDKLNDTMEEIFKIENITYFISTMMPEFELNWHHLEWGDWVNRFLRICILCSRDGGKSFYFSNAYPIWKMYRYRKFNPLDPFPRKDLHLSQRGFIMTSEMDLGIELMEILKDTIESNDALRDKLFPGGKSDGWSKISIKTKNGCKLTVKSYGGSFRGRHPGYMVLDDYLRENVIYSATQREKSNKYFFATVMNALLKEGQICVVGTPMHELDIYGELKKKKRWIVLEYPAIFPDGTILWPGRYNYQDLMAIQDEHGSLIFARERLVRPIMNETSIFPYKFIKRSFEGMEDFKLVSNRESYKKDFLYIVCGVDLAISAEAGADYSVYTVWGIDRNFNMWLMYVWRKKGASYNEQISTLHAIHLNFSCDLFCIESNQFQAVIGEGAEDLGLPVFLHNTGTNKYNFKYGLPAMAVMFERRKMHLPRGDKFSKEMTDLMSNEFTSVTWTDKGLEAVGAHDDMVMSAWKGYVGMKNIDSVNFGVL